MAARLTGMLLNRLKPNLLGVKKGQALLQPVAKRTIVYTETGAVLSEPQITSLGIIRVLVVVLPTLYLGATIGKEGAAFMEENDIFVPDDDDDD